MGTRSLQLDFDEDEEFAVLCKPTPDMLAALLEGATISFDFKENLRQSAFFIDGRCFPVASAQQLETCDLVEVPTNFRGDSCTQIAKVGQKIQVQRTFDKAEADRVRARNEEQNRQQRSRTTLELDAAVPRDKLKARNVVSSTVTRHPLNATDKASNGKSNAAQGPAELSPRPLPVKPSKFGLAKKAAQKEAQKQSADAVVPAQPGSVSTKSPQLGSDGKAAGTAKLLAQRQNALGAKLDTPSVAETAAAAQNQQGEKLSQNQQQIAGKPAPPPKPAVKDRPMPVQAPIAEDDRRVAVAAAREKDFSAVVTAVLFGRNLGQNTLRKEVEKAYADAKLYNKTLKPPDGLARMIPETCKRIANRSGTSVMYELKPKIKEDYTNRIRPKYLGVDAPSTALPKPSGRAAKPNMPASQMQGTANGLAGVKRKAETDAAVNEKATEPAANNNSKRLRKVSPPSTQPKPQGLQAVALEDDLAAAAAAAQPPAKPGPKQPPKTLKIRPVKPSPPTLQTQKPSGPSTAAQKPAQAGAAVPKPSPAAPVSQKPFPPVSGKPSPTERLSAKDSVMEAGRQPAKESAVDAKQQQRRKISPPVKQSGAAQKAKEQQAAAQRPTDQAALAQRAVAAAGATQTATAQPAEKRSRAAVVARGASADEEDNQRVKKRTRLHENGPIDEPTAAVTVTTRQLPADAHKSISPPGSNSSDKSSPTTNNSLLHSSPFSSPAVEDEAWFAQHINREPVLVQAVPDEKHFELYKEEYNSKYTIYLRLYKVIQDYKMAMLGAEKEWRDAASEHDKHKARQTIYNLHTKHASAVARQDKAFQVLERELKHLKALLTAWYGDYKKAQNV